MASRKNPSTEAALSKQSAGLLLYRGEPPHIGVLLVHPGGPFWKRRDEGAWSIPKGEIEQGETPMEVAQREFAEELGGPPPGGALASLGSIRQAGGKVVHAWAEPGDLDVTRIESSTFSMEWPLAEAAVRLLVFERKLLLTKVRLSKVPYRG